LKMQNMSSLRKFIFNPLRTMGGVALRTLSGVEVRTLSGVELRTLSGVELRTLSGVEVYLISACCMFRLHSISRMLAFWSRLKENKM